MEGVTVLPFRLWLWLASAPAHMTTPFLRLTASYPAGELPPPFAPECDTLKSYVPYTLIPQVMASDVDHCLKALPQLNRLSPVIEINCGCPSPLCSGKGAGSGLLKDLGRFHRMISDLTVALGPQRLAVKMRTGFHDASEFEGLFRGIASLPLHRLTVHGRTRRDRYTGRARWDLIQWAARETRVPVIFSGDLVDHTGLSRLRGLSPEASGAIIGRGLLRNPWIFRELATGTSVSLSLSTLIKSLMAFGLLHRIHFEDSAAPGESRLAALVKDGLLAAPCGTEAAAWDRVLGKIYDALGLSGSQVTEITLGRQTMGRLKMLWHHLRTSLPEPFFSPALMRATELGPFIEGLRACAAQNKAEPDSKGVLRLGHNSGHDWLFSGLKSP
jgi:tRNA-dihydrouridine synthase